MCGIVGYVGPHPALGFLLEGLHRLEYRGYDSAGVALLDGGRIDVRRKTGRVSQVEELCRLDPPVGTTGIGHTRWATHGVPSDINAHPHTGGDGEVVLVHNGVIENYTSLRSQLISQGYTFHSATDTEVVAHLVAAQLKREIKLGGKASDPQTCLRAVETAVSQLKGTFGLAVLFRDAPGLLIAARLGSPLVIGVGKDEFFLASDASPLVGHTERVVYLKDHEIAVITAKDFEIVHRETGSQTPDVRILEQTSQDTELGEFEHYMLKEIFEQPQTVENALRGRLDEEEATARFGGLNLDPQMLRGIDRIILTACGTSWHAGLVGEYLIEEFARIPVEVEYASELRYRNPPLSDRTMIFAITQSGETADTLAAMRECKRKGHPTLAICNVVGSSIAREADGGIYLHAGPEIGVASTKAFTCQLAVLAALAAHLALKK
ncbi:MAG TPA: glutamine--fructose-6-phosphate transaminase (isomerizing), partial [Planctomycetaceae bacterium]|nr:glutamine--fructose-6-phosphate transaminase (isomerizing) [Planctomycetaceae bacterium]